MIYGAGVDIWERTATTNIGDPKPDRASCFAVRKFTKYKNKGTLLRQGAFFAGDSRNRPYELIVANSMIGLSPLIKIVHCPLSIFNWSRRPGPGLVKNKQYLTTDLYFISPTPSLV